MLCYYLNKVVINKRNKLVKVFNSQANLIVSIG